MQGIEQLYKMLKSSVQQKHLVLSWIGISSTSSRWRSVKYWAAAVPPNCTPENKWNNKRLLKIRDQRILCWLSFLSLVHSRISSCVCSSIHYCYYSPSQDPDQDRSMGQQGYKINTPGPMASKSRSTIVSIQPMVPALQLCSQIGVGLKLFGLYYRHQQAGFCLHLPLYLLGVATTLHILWKLFTAPAQNSKIVAEKAV